MGNSNSIEDEDSDPFDPQMQDQNSTEDVDLDENLLDFCALFDTEARHRALMNMKEPPGNILSHHKEALVKWLKNLVDRDETTVNMAQFVDFLSSKIQYTDSATTSQSPKDEAMQVFNDLDAGGEGVVDITWLLSRLKGNMTEPMQALQPCHELPGPLDVYLPEKPKLKETAKKILQFIHRNRVDSKQLMMPLLSQIHVVIGQRLKVVEGRYYALRQRESDQVMLRGAGEEGEEGEGGTEKQLIRKCYSSITLSTNSKSVDNLLNSNMDSYWQSNGSPRSHWIRIHMLPGVMVKELAISVNTSDDSYMPKNLTVSVGHQETSLKEIRKLTVPRACVGKFMLLKDLSAEYRFIQINIRGCHNDGCDVRVRGLHVTGCKFVQEVQPTVLDTMAVWYLGIVGSTARVAMPIAPQLRQLILKQSESALKNLPPLSISPFSPTKPEFISSFVLEEMKAFLSNICVVEGSPVDVDSIRVLLSFALAHGNVAHSVEVIMNLLNNLSLELKVGSLLQKMNSILNTKLLKHADILKLSLVSCDGGQKDGDHKPELMLANKPSNPCYVSETGKKVVTVTCKMEQSSSQIMHVTKFLIRVQSGDQGAKAGLVFLTDEDPSTFEGEKLEAFSAWTAESYKSSETSDDFNTKPIAYFELEKDITEVEFMPDKITTGKFLTVRFLGPKKEDAERIGVQSVNVMGYHYTGTSKRSVDLLNQIDTITPIPPSTSPKQVPVKTLLMRLLHFFCWLMRDLHVLQTRRKAASLDFTVLTESHLTVDSLTLEKIWKLYLAIRSSELDGYATLLCLYLLRMSLPYIRPGPKPKQDASSASPTPPPDPVAAPSAVLSHLCDLLNSPDTDEQVLWIVQDIVTEGVVVFFPDAKARKEYLLSMIDSVLEANQPKSWWLKFEAMCHYFSKTDSKSVLSLPLKTADVNEEALKPALNILNTMLMVAKRDALQCLSTGATKPNDLARLLSALQASLFFWSRSQLSSEEIAEKDGAKSAICRMIVAYVETVSEHCVEVLQELDKNPDNVVSHSDALEKTLLGRVLPEMVVCLGTMVETDLNRQKLLRHLQPLLSLLTSITARLPSSISESSETDASKLTESVVGLWTRESPHNYDNNSRVSEDFYCPSAIRFCLEFDSRCRTERRYDYLEFTEESGNKHKCDGELGQERWPAVLECKGQRLQFKFYSDGSNNEWGYKFTIRAYGHTYQTLHWLNDLNVSICHLLGQICSTLLTTPPPSATPTSKKEDSSKASEAKKQDELLVSSDLWKTLFRGGYRIGKLTRSLSGAYSAKPAEAEVSAILSDLANGPEGAGVKLVLMCRETLKGQYYGGPQVDSAVNAVFAALIMHSQECREELATFAAVERTGIPSVSPGLLNAFKFAEFIRRELVENRQKLIEAKEKEEDEDKKFKIEEDSPVESCQSKARYLLNFAGVSRAPTRKMTPEGSPRLRPSWATKGKNWNKISTAVSTVGKLKQQLQETSEREKINEKYPSSELVLNFVRTDSLTIAQVSSLLEQRSDMAASVAQGYNYCADVIKTLGMENLFELPGLTFLQQLLARQRYFPKHYAAKLDGCGLDLENQVRKAYRSLVLQVVDAYNNYKSPQTKDHAFSRLLVLLYVLHLLDFNWQEYDHSLLNELNLPDLYLNSAINCLGVKEQHKIEKFDGEEKMLEQYEFFMKLMEKFEALNGRSWKSLLDDAEEQDLKNTHLFLVAVAHKHPNVISIQCDGCSTTVKSWWYRDIDATTDLDLCTQCFENGSWPRPSHYEEGHKFLALGRFGCDGCKMTIVTHRFHSKTRPDFDLCMGCFRKEEATGKSDTWTVFLQTEQPATSKSPPFLTMYPSQSPGFSYKDGVMLKLSPSVDLGIYAQHHCWLLFSSLTLSMANAVNNNTGGTEVEYVHQACNTMETCLRLLAFILRAALLAKFEEAERKTAEDKKEAEEKKKEEEARKKEEETSTTSRVVIDTQSSNDTGDPSPSAHTPMEDTDFDLRPGEEKMETEPSAATTLSEIESMETDSCEVGAKEGEKETEKEDEPKGESANETEGANASVPSGEVKEKEKSVEPDSAVEKVEGEEAMELGEESKPEEDPVAVASRRPREVDGKIGELEKMYGVLMLEKALGLLSAVLPQDMTLLPWIQYRRDIEVFLVQELLPSVLQLTSCSAVSESQRLQALLVTAQYLAHLNPEVADRVINVARGATPPAKQPENWTHGTLTVQFLFSMGAGFLMKSQFSGAATCAECILLLSEALPWKSAVSLTLGQCLKTPPQDMDLSSIFGLLVISGFPKIPREGGVVHTSLSDKPSRVLLMSVDNDNASGIDVSTRQPVQLKLSEYELEDTLKGCIDKSKLPTLLTLLKSSLHLVKEESDKHVERMWILALVLKALHFIIQNSTTEDVIKSLLDAGMIPVLVKLASRPTHINKKWFLTDLEVLGISSYLPQGETPTAKPEQAAKTTTEAPPTSKDDGITSTTGDDKTGGDKEEDEEDDDDDNSLDKEAERILVGVSEADRAMLRTMTEVFMCPLSVVRAMYDDVEGDMSRFIASTEQFCEEGGFKPSEEILEASKKWETPAKKKSNTEESSLSLEDTGVTRITPIEQDIKALEAVPEESSIFKKMKNLLKDTDKPLSLGKNSENPNLKREDSYRLLWDELGKKEPTSTRESLCKTLQGVAVLRARLVLATLLSNWPQEGRRLSTTFLGCSDIIHYFCLLDLLLHQQTTEEREKLLMTVLTCGETTEMMTLAVTAAQCMNKVAISREVREFTHKGKAEGKLKESGKVVINNASSLEITFYPVNGGIEFASSESMVDHHKNVTGSVTKQVDPMKHTIPGDTVHYQLQLQPVSEAKYPRCMFTVTGIQEGRFDTGFLILSLMMDKKEQFASWLPVEQLWPLLIGVACQHTGQERLKVIGLLMELINFQSSKEGEGDGWKKKMQLSALKPLWQLYTTIIKDYDGRSKTQQGLSPDIVRVLTELFLCVENLSKEWGISQELMVETLTKEGLNCWLEKGISNVAFVSLALGIDNFASRTFIQERKKYKPEEQKPPTLSSLLSILADGTEEDDDDDDDDDDDSDSDEEDLYNDESTYSSDDY